MKRNRIGLIVIERSDDMTDLPEQFNENVELITRAIEGMTEENRKLEARIAQIENWQM